MRPPNLTRLAETTEDLLRDLLQRDAHWKFEVELWDGRRVRPPVDPVACVRIRDAAALRSLFLDGNTLAFAETYLSGQIDLEGDLPAVIELADALIGAPMPWRAKLKMFTALLSIPSVATRNGHQRAEMRGTAGSRERVKAAVSYHYDRPVGFWLGWLDSHLQYTCAYYRSASDGLELAQQQKLELVCRKLGLRRGHRLLDVGCGWGGLMVFAARHRGVSSVGVTLSREQADYARAWIAREGLAELCRVELCDFRDVRSFGEFDAVSGLGVLEHLGAVLAEDYFAAAFHALKPGGRFFNQAIACSVTAPLRGGESFMDTYIFPDTSLMPVRQTIDFAEQAGFEVRDVENLREHYALTLRAWLANLERAADAIRRETSEATYRAFRLYLAGCAHDFERGRLALYQTLLSKPAHGRSGLPFTREEWVGLPAFPAAGVG